MVVSQHEEVLWILDLVCEQQTYYCLEGLLPAVNIVTEKQVVTFWRKAAIFKQSQQVVVLTMDVTADFQRSFC